MGGEKKSINQQDSESHRISLWIKNRGKKEQNAILRLHYDTIIKILIDYWRVKIKGNPTSRDWNESQQLTVRLQMIANDMTLSNARQGALV